MPTEVSDTVPAPPSDPGTATPRRSLGLSSEVTADGTVELSLVERSVPVPEAGEVIVRVEAAPINPSDLWMLLAGADPRDAEAAGSDECPRVALPLSQAARRAVAKRVGLRLPVGNEGAGTVVAAGASAAAQELLGKQVALVGGGMYSQFRAAAAADCLVLPKGLGAERGAAAMINPMTALGMVETALVEGHIAIVHTAAASSLGQMLNRLCLRERIPLVNVVRTAEQADLLREAGAEQVCDSSAESFLDDLTEALRATGATIGFDATGGGRLADQILSCMESALGDGAGFETYGSATHKQVYLYGSLDRAPTLLSRGYGMSWGVGGWLLTRFLAEAGPERVGRLRGKVTEGLTTIFAGRFTDALDLREALRPEVVAIYGRPATGRKFLVKPNDWIGVR